MTAKELLARDLNAMLVNGKAEIVTDGVRITVYEVDDETGIATDIQDVINIDKPTGSWDDEYF